MLRKNQKPDSRKEKILFSSPEFSLIFLILVIGWLILAIIDQNYRAGYAKIAELSVTFLLGLVLANPMKNRT